MTLEDREHLKAIAEAPDDERTVHLILSYWHDQDRTDRTPRDYLVLHLGIVCGICDRLMLARGREIWNTPELFDIARDIAHKHGMPWTDPRTGETILPPEAE